MADQQTRTVSLQIPSDAMPGDTLTFTVDGTELELAVPDRANAGQVLQIQVVCGAPQHAPDEEEVTRVAINDNDTMLVLHHCIPANDNDKNSDADGTHAMAWPAGLELAKCLSSLPSDTKEYIRQCETVLELGSGTGLVGLALAANKDYSCLSKTILLSDCSSAMPLLKYNVQKNQHLLSPNVHIETQELNWGDNKDQDITKYDLIVGSDLLYNAKMIPSLVSTLKKLRAKSRVLLATRWRKPNLERQFFQDSSDFIEWKLLSLPSSTCTLSWEAYGDAQNQLSNQFFMQTMVAVQGTLKRLANITESDMSNMTNEEHEAWERLQIQIYEGTVTTKSERVTKRARREP